LRSTLLRVLTDCLLVCYLMVCIETEMVALYLLYIRVHFCR